MNPKIRLSSPHMSGEEIKYIKEAIDTNWVAPVGKNLSIFEEALENFLGPGSYVTALISGTAAIHLSLILAGVNKGDIVLCQSMTFAASAFPILYLGAEPVFIDSETETWNMCPTALEESINYCLKRGKKPKAIVVIHIFGMPAKMDEILKISQKYEIPIIEDAAEALGSEYNGLKCGAIGDFGILSFNGNKIITTSGGGALVCKTSTLKDKAIFLSTQAKEDAAWYQHSEIGYNYRMSNILAGIGSAQMEVLNQFVQRRRHMNEFYKEMFKPHDFVKVLSEPSKHFFSNHWLTCIQITSNKRNKSALGLFEHLKKNQIESKYIWKPLHLQPIFKKYHFFGSDVSETLFQHGLCLPSGSNLVKSDKELISKVVLEYLDA